MFQGAICLDTLGTAWSPILTLKSALISLQSLLASPEPKDPQDAEVARMLLTDSAQFHRVAAEWAVKYADAPADGKTGVKTYADDLRSQEERKKQLEEAQRLAQYVESSLAHIGLANSSTDTVATTQRWSIVGPPWVLMYQPSSAHSWQLALTAIKDRIMICQRHKSTISPQNYCPSKRLLSLAQR